MASPVDHLREQRADRECGAGDDERVRPLGLAGWPGLRAGAATAPARRCRAPGSSAPRPSRARPSATASASGGTTRRRRARRRACRPCRPWLRPCPPGCRACRHPSRLLCRPSSALRGWLLAGRDAPDPRRGAPRDHRRDGADGAVEGHPESLPKHAFNFATAGPRQTWKAPARCRCRVPKARAPAPDPEPDCAPSAGDAARARSARSPRPAASSRRRRSHATCASSGSRRCRTRWDGRATCSPAGRRDLRRREALAAILGQYGHGVTAAQNLVVIRSELGSAPAIARALDRVEHPLVVGTLAGDDTCLVIARGRRRRGDAGARAVRYGQIGRVGADLGARRHLAVLVEPLEPSASRSSSTRPSVIVPHALGRDVARLARSSPGVTASPLKMSLPVSPTTSCTLPSSSPSEPTTCQPFSIRSHETGSAAQTAFPSTYQTGPCVATLCVSESARRIET